ncbi:hypothetical protein [Blastococcus montanus]|uniref:hypothetical protein n=1 Tax=Blastococcus montanus TaxID=3144973 RepID=UPI0032080E1A
MRPRHVATALAALTAGIAAGAALHRRAGGDRPGTTATPVRPAPARPAPVDARTDAVVLPFVRPGAGAPADRRPDAPARCGDSGGRTKAGAPCAARAATSGRCHHHPLAA